VGSQFFKPYVIVVMKTCFIVIDKYGGCYVHGVTQYESLLNLAFPEAFIHLGRDIDKPSPIRYLKP
jgi:hypothetical protein